MPVAGVLAAYRSTIETHLNWGTSYLVHDLYRRFLVPSATEPQLLRLARLATAGSLIAFQSGPSRSADIEKTLILGVHGPRRVHVILVAGG